MAGGLSGGLYWVEERCLPNHPGAHPTTKKGEEILQKGFERFRAAECEPGKGKVVAMVVVLLLLLPTTTTQAIFQIRGEEICINPLAYLTCRAGFLPVRGNFRFPLNCSRGQQRCCLGTDLFCNYFCHSD